VVRLRRHAESNGDLTESEVLQFRHVASALEFAWQSAFGTTVFNWSCLMNLAFRANPPDPHVHWWLVPRGDQVVDFAGVGFEHPESVQSCPRVAAVWKVLHAIPGELARNLVL
jgi:diadenosine tetraphosphate (Ap4A) HIT family hydrolase